MDSATNHYKKQIAQLKDEITQLTYKKNDLERQVAKNEQALARVQSELRKSFDIFNMEDFGLYEPRFDFQSVDEFRAALKDVREDQKVELRQLMERAKDTPWTVNGSKKEGQKVVRDVQKLLMRAFNGDCDEIVRKVKSSNVLKSLESIEKSAKTVNRLGKTLWISVSDNYVSLKKEEVMLAYEYAQFKEEEREHQRILREQEREQKALEKELAEKRKALQKDVKHVEQALQKIEERIEAEDDDSASEDLIEQREVLMAQLEEVQQAVKEVDYREAKPKAGYVYIISNIGAFGEDVYKIGVTRRLNPDERVRELAVASVPFPFDTHAMIFSDDAFALESALHNAFARKRLNLVNTRKEFYHVSLDEIKAVVRQNYDKTVEFISFPEAEQYRESEKIREQYREEDMLQQHDSDGEALQNDSQYNFGLSDELINQADDLANRKRLSKAGVVAALMDKGTDFDSACQAAEAVNADWNINALARARAYRSRLGLTKDQLIVQLGDGGEQFSDSEIEYAVANL